MGGMGSSTITWVNSKAIIGKAWVNHNVLNALTERVSLFCVAAAGCGRDAVAW